MKPAFLLAAALVLPNAFVVGVHAASFNCAKAGTAVERMICANPKLSSMDEKLNKAYRDALATGPKPELLTSYQRDWLKDVRNKCKDVPCLEQVYQSRLDDFYSPGKPTVRK
jgi:uncharacterized protein